jgi:hypothetical protein
MREKKSESSPTYVSKSVRREGPGMSSSVLVAI